MVSQEEIEVNSFADLGIVESLVAAMASFGWNQPTQIQAQSIPYALKVRTAHVATSVSEYVTHVVHALLQGKDVIALAETGSGKTGVFVLPILQSLLQNPQRLHALVLTPTRYIYYNC